MAQQLQKQFPNKIDEKHNSEMRIIPIYKPFPADLGNSQSILQNREMLGKMEVRFALTGCWNNNYRNKLWNQKNRKRKIIY